MSPLRIGLTCHSSVGGSGVIASELGLALAERGHQVHFICAHAPPRLLDSRAVTLHEVTSPTHALLPHGDFTLALASRLAEVSRRHALQVLHVHYALPMATSALLARELLGPQAPRLVTTVHGTDVLQVGLEPTFKPLVRLSLQRSDAVTAPSRFLAEAAQQGLSLEGPPVEVIGNFVDTERFAPGPRAPTALFAQPPLKVITHSSNFRALKRVDDVVRLFSRVRQRGLDCGLVLIGDGPERPAVERLIAELGLTRWVRLLGEQREVAPLLRGSDVFVLPSEVESFGLAALEAMSCGVPVVATATGGLPEVLVDGVTGFLHPVGDVEAMADSTCRLLQDASLHHRVAAAARARAVSTWQRGPRVDAYLALYERLLGAS